MSPAAELNELAARKRLLVAESEVNRRVLQLETARLAASIAKAEEVCRIGRSAYPFVLGLAPIAGWLFSRKAGGVKGIVATATVLLGAFRKIRPLWETLRKTSQSKDGEAEKAAAESSRL